MDEGFRRDTRKEFNTMYVVSLFKFMNPTGRSTFPRKLSTQTVVERNSFQDLYLELKEKYAHLESRVISEFKAGKEDVKRLA